MKSDKELFTLAKNMVFIQDNLLTNVDELTREELQAEVEKIRNTLLEKGYDLNTFLHYQELYKAMSIEEYYKFIKTLN